MTPPAKQLQHQQQWPRGPENELHHAVGRGSIKQVTALLSKGSINIDQGCPRGLTPLIIAAQYGHSSILQILLNRAANVSIATDDGTTALHLSASEGHLSPTVDLVKAGADLEATVSKGFTPLFSAAQKGHWAVVAALVEAGADVDHRAGDGRTPLHVAAMNGHLGTVKELLRANANPLLAGRSSTVLFPLDVAAHGGHSEVVFELIQKYGIEGCGGGSGGAKALEGAATYGHVGVMAMLMDAGVVDTGEALFHAAARSREAAVKLLLQQQRGIGYVNFVNKHGMSPLYGSINAFPDEGGVPHLVSPKVVRLLIDAGADTSSPFRLTNASGRVLANYTPLACTTDRLRTQLMPGKNDTREEQRCRLEAVRRLLLRVEAVHAVSWLWPKESVLVGGGTATSKVSSTGTAGKTPAEGTSLALMLPIMRRRRRGVLLGTLFRYSDRL